MEQNSNAPRGMGKGGICPPSHFMMQLSIVIILVIGNSQM